jgi:phosphatidylglycerol:prolipoprotein diacylglycerol transferase
MHPTLLELPSHGVTIASYHACILLAVIVCVAIGPRWVAALEWLNRGRVFRAILVLAVAAFAGGRLHFVVNQWSTFVDTPLAALHIWSGGLHAGGAIAMLAVAIPPTLRWQGLPPGRFADGFVPTIGVGIAIARLGCLLHGCCFGTPSSLPWAVAFPSDSFIYHLHADHGLIAAGAARSLPIHPLPLYFIIAALLTAVAALWLHRRKRYDGEVAWVSLVLFSASTALLELLRADTESRVYWGPLPQLTWMAYAMTAVSLAALIVAERRYRRRRVRAFHFISAGAAASRQPARGDIA